MIWYDSTWYRFSLYFFVRKPIPYNVRVNYYRWASECNSLERQNSTTRHELRLRIYSQLYTSTQKTWCSFDSATRYSPVYLHLNVEEWDCLPPACNGRAMDRLHISMCRRRSQARHSVSSLLVAMIRVIDITAGLASSHGSVRHCSTFPLCKYCTQFSNGLPAMLYTHAVEVQPYLVHRPAKCPLLQSTVVF